MSPSLTTISSAAAIVWFTGVLWATAAQAGDPEEDAPPADLSQGMALFADFAFDQAWRQNWGVPWVQRGDAAERLPGEKVPAGEVGLVVTYPEGAVGPSDGGLQFPASFARIAGLEAGYDQLYLTYFVKFAEDFDFRRGGKLPGLMGEGDSWARAGGDQPDGGNGWTLRLMWRPEGRAVVYSYLPPSDHGKYGSATWGLDMYMGDSHFAVGQWHRIDQYVRVNDPGKENGLLIMWLDGEPVLSLDDITYQRQPDGKGRVGGIFFSSFHGGNDESWAPEHISMAYFAGFSVSTDRPMIDGQPLQGPSD